MMIASGSYYECIQAISVHGIQHETGWHTIKKTPHKVQYQCCQKRCRCKAEVHLKEDGPSGEIIYEAIIIGSHQDHDKPMSKPLREHLVAAVTNAMSSGAKGLKEAVATEVKVQVSQRKISRIKKLEKLDGDWESLWRKLPSFIDTINEKQKLGFIDEEKFFVFISFPYVQNFTRSMAFLGVVFVDGTFCSDHCKSTLLSAVTVTSDRIILPLGTAITTGETKEIYTMFLNQLRNYVEDRNTLVFMTGSISSNPIISVYLLSI